MDDSKVTVMYMPSNCSLKKSIQHNYACCCAEENTVNATEQIVHV